MGGEDGWGCWVVGVRGWVLTACEAMGLGCEALVGALTQEACHWPFLIACPMRRLNWYVRGPFYKGYAG